MQLLRLPTGACPRYFGPVYNPQPKMQLVAHNCSIRSMRPDDAESLAANANNLKVWLQLRDAMPHPYSVNDAEKFISFATSQSPETTFAIDVAGDAVGTIGVTLLTDINRYCAELGFWLGEAHWGQGIATSAVAAMTDWAANEFSLHRIFAVPFADNRASCRVLEKAGYRREGLMQRSAVKNGQIKDQILYAAAR